MRGLLKRLWKRLFCRHNYVKIAFMEKESDGIRYSERLYRCIKCGKQIWVDGRDDFIKNHSGR